MTDHRETVPRSDQQRLHMTPWRLVIAAACCLIGVFITLLLLDPGAYHRWQHVRLMTRLGSGGQSTMLMKFEEELFGEDTDRVMFHRRALMDLGELHLLTFPFGDMSSNERERLRRLYVLLRERRGTFFYHRLRSVGVAGEPGVLVDLDLWCDPQYSEEWAELLEEFHSTTERTIVEPETPE
jgi:hypothetical protein